MLWDYPALFPTKGVTGSIVSDGYIFARHDDFQYLGDRGREFRVSVSIADLQTGSSVPSF